MNYREEVAGFCSAGVQLRGILARPDLPGACGVVIVVGGPQYRAGSHRQFVLLSRALASAGYPVLRFDFQGMGDSDGEPQGFQASSADIASAISALLEMVPSVTQIALWGLCDGASAALLYCHDTQDPRIETLCLVNPWVRSEQGLARTQIKHYYRQRVLSPGFWRKVMHGGVRLDALRGLLGSVRTAMHKGPAQCAGPATFQQRMASAWKGFSGCIFLLLSANDYTAKEFLQHAQLDPAWRNALHHPGLVHHEQAGADHTFSSAAQRACVAELTLRLGLNNGSGPSSPQGAQRQPGPPSECHIGPQPREHEL